LTRGRTIPESADASIGPFYIARRPTVGDKGPGSKSKDKKQKGAGKKK
jgi:hypothetical protein